MLQPFSTAILVKWLPPDNVGLVCVTGYKLEWGENTPFQFSTGPQHLRSDQTEYVIKGLSKYTLYNHFFFSCDIIDILIFFSITPGKLSFQDFLDINVTSN